MAATDPRADRVLKFWFNDVAPEQWWKADASFDEIVRERFGELHEEAAAGKCDGWMQTAPGALALILVLDQFSRNLYRGRPEAFAWDEKARGHADEAVEKGFDLETDETRRPFFYMPYMHAEDLGLQDRCIALIRERIGPESANLPHAIWHREVIETFGRFPYRNRALGRTTTPEEAEFLARENVPG